MKKKFDTKALEPELSELSTNFQTDGNLNVLFDWFDLPEHNWEYGSQQRFLSWVEKTEKERAKKAGKKTLSKAAIRKRYQRNQKIPPEQRISQLARKEQRKKLRENHSSERFIQLLESTPSAVDNFDDISDECQLLQLGSIKEPLSRAFEEASRVTQIAHMFSEKTMRYRLNSSIISAHGLWINQDIVQSVIRLHMDSVLGEIFLELALGETRLEPDQGLFFVFAGSQMVKNAKILKDGYERIQKKREDLIKSGIREEQDQLYVFKQNYAFSSPSLAASVLLGENVNGQIYWRDYRGKTFKELHPKFDKIKRGPGRPKKGS